LERLELSQPVEPGKRQGHGSRGLQPPQRLGDPLMHSLNADAAVHAREDVAHERVRELEHRSVAHQQPLLHRLLLVELRPRACTSGQRAAG
jgi:hypothetical protein